MPTPTLPLRGQCRCGATTIEVTAAPIMTAACHCTGCQRMSGSAFSLTAMIPTAGFAVTKGEPVVGGAKSEGLEHMFCPDCMTWMFTRPAGVEFVNLRPTMLEDHAWFTPFIETMTEAKLPWVSLPVAHSFPAFPAMEDFGPLMSEFAAAQA
ncbi:GFA family protein [Pseudooceanicola onchidii]|uniref:GFA family protein n=1 Tax=Pseudooceanicola onchidii TaxID=2562279 RepID=UPI0010AA543E|nr:GFA family protein [Pseudooceanicola onchidii]